MQKVAILVETSLASGRQILAGISRFLHEEDRWAVFHRTGPLGAINPEALRSWRGDGVIARIANRSIYRMVAGMGIPVVDVLGNVPGSGFPTVTCDEPRISSMVASHLVGRGVRHFAYFGLADEGWSVRRREALEAEVGLDPGHTFSALMIRQRDKARLSWGSYLRLLCGWIGALPRPLGIMVASDQFGPDIIEACRHLGLTIPEEVSVVGVDNDGPFCEVCVPRLSSVLPNHELVGYEAAHLLDHLMRGERVARDPVLIPPLSLKVRRSSDAAALADPCLVKAMNLIRRRACAGLSVDDVAREAGLSRSVLQRRFRAVLGETVLAAMVRTRLARAREMLGNTDLPLAEIAERCGFNHPEYMGYVFRRELGVTPAGYRRRSGSPTRTTWFRKRRDYVRTAGPGRRAAGGL